MEEQNETDEFLSLAEHEKRYIKEALETTGWVVSGEHGAAHLLGINAQTLRSRIKKHGLHRPGTKAHQ
jgi:formate hydrogenlyase transcriptional activator